MVDIFEFAKNNNIESIEFSYNYTGKYYTIRIYKNGKTAFLGLKEESLFRPDADFIVKMELRKLIKELEKES